MYLLLIWSRGDIFLDVPYGIAVPLMLLNARFWLPRVMMIGFMWFTLIFSIFWEVWLSKVCS